MKNSALQAVLFFYVATPGYEPVVMKIRPFRSGCRTDLKSQDYHNRTVIDLRKTKSKKATACKAEQVIK